MTIPKMTMTLDDLIAALERKAAEKLKHRNTLADGIKRLRATESLTEDDRQTLANLRQRKDDVDAELDVLEIELSERRREQRSAAAAQRLAAQVFGGTTAEEPNSRGVARSMSASQWIRTQDGRPATVAQGARFANHEIVADHIARMERASATVIGQHGSLGNLVRSMTTTSGSAIVPTVWLGDVIDRARNFAAVLQAGAEIVPMEAKTVQIGRLTGDPTSAFRTEGSTIAPSDPVLDNVTLDAKTMSTLIVGSMEWFQDADNVDEVVTNAIAQAFAGELDLVALYGSITAGAGAINLPTPPNPRGVLGTLNAVASSSVLGAATNGTAQTVGGYYNELLDLVYKPQEFNETPNALIVNSKLARQYAGAYDTTGQPLRAPADLEGLTRYISNTVPSYTQGTMASRATDAFVGDWSQVLIGQRLDLSIQTLVERYAENGQIGIVAHWRGDVGIARPRAFAVYKALQGAL